MVCGCLIVSEEIGVYHVPVHSRAKWRGEYTSGVRIEVYDRLERLVAETESYTHPQLDTRGWIAIKALETGQAYRMCAYYAGDNDFKDFRIPVEKRTIHFPGDIVIREGTWIDLKHPADWIIRKAHRQKTMYNLKVAGGFGVILGTVYWLIVCGGKGK